MSDKIFIGLTGSFGSGCSTLANVLSSKHDFLHIKLSDIIREESQRRGLPIEQRNNLQDIGNLLRKENGPGYLVQLAIDKAQKTAKTKVVFDGIRNVGELIEFRNYPYFYLVAVDCSRDNRWARLKPRYNNNEILFSLHDKRDKNEGLLYGQQVLRCVEEADILFVNESEYKTQNKIIDEIDNRFSPLLGLITREKMRNPNINETMMTVASTLALHSHCIKRRVGAVLCAKDGYIISAAYNEVPYGQNKCMDEYKMCYRDFFRNEQKRETITQFKYCPFCSKELKISGDKFNCESCNNDISTLMPGYKALDKCRSLHAEETTILKAAHYQINDSILYTTTFPCLQCTKRILHSGIKTVIYIDPYPEEEAIVMLETGKVRTEKFQGVKAQAYYRLFYPYREQLEKETKSST